MSDEIRSLTDTEIDAVSGGLQYNENTQNYLMSPLPDQPNQALSLNFVKITEE